MLDIVKNELWSWHFPRGWAFFPSDPWHSHRKPDLPSTFRNISVQNWTWLGLPTPNLIETHHSCTLRWQSVYFGACAACAYFDQTRFAPRFSTLMWQRFLHPTSWAWTCQRSWRVPWIQNQPQCSTYQFHFTFGKMAAQTSAQRWFSTKQIISLQCQSSLDTSSWIPQDTDWSGSPSPCQIISWIQGSSKYQMKGFTWQTMLRRKILPIVAGVCVATVLQTVIF